jgi:phage terminase large subunit
VNVDFNPSLKQDEFFESFDDSRYSEVLYGGAAGGGKSYILWGLLILKCVEYPGIRVGLGRHTLVEIKKNTITSFYEVYKNLNLPPDYYKYNPIEGKITFKNGSEIIFYELRYLPSDPNYDRFGGALLTFAAIEEAGGVEEKGKLILQSRCGRWKNDEYSIKPKLFMTCNPSMNFLYTDFYRPYQKGELEDFRKYIPALLTDNPYRPKDYQENLEKTLNEEAKSRLLRGEWDFDGDKSRLLKYEEILDIYNGNSLDSGAYYLSADIAFTSDKCIILLWQGLTVKEIIHYDGDAPEQEIIRLRDKYNINPHNIVYDADGVGHYLKGKLRQAKAFVNNSQPIKVQGSKQNFDHLKSQVYWKLAEKIKDGSVKVADNNLKEELIQELYEIKSQPLETLDGKLKLVRKKDVHAVIGRSPDISDAMAYRMIFEIKGAVRRPF